ncbi:D-serine dehydratase, partial [Acinetobacter baumannii]
HVHCISAEPTHSPCLLLGVATGLHDEISVQALGIDNITAADGLAVGRASGFVGRAMQRLLDGFYTLSDESMYLLLGLLNDSEQLKLEPSALAGMLGPILIHQQQNYATLHQLSQKQFKNANHIIWGTGGGMVPEEEMEKYLAKAHTLNDK